MQYNAYSVGKLHCFISKLQRHWVCLVLFPTTTDRAQMRFDILLSLRGKMKFEWTSKAKQSYTDRK